jgi:hypothetical protein
MDFIVDLPKPGYPVVRRWARHNVDVPVRIFRAKWFDATAARCLGSHVNCGGMTICEVELALGQQVFLEFRSPHSGQLRKMWGVVRNHHGDRYGIEFITEDETA